MPKLVEHLTLQLDTTMVGVILMTFPTFTSTEELLNLAFMRYNMPRPKNQKELSRFVNERLNPIRFRVLNFLKTWVDSYWSDFASLKSAQEKVLALAREAKQDSLLLNRTADQLEKLMNKKVCSCSCNSRSRVCARANSV